MSFSVTREAQQHKTTTKYTGKLDGDTLKLKAEREPGSPTSRPAPPTDHKTGGPRLATKSRPGREPGPVAIHATRPMPESADGLETVCAATGLASPGR